MGRTRLEAGGAWWDRVCGGRGCGAGTGIGLARVGPTREPAGNVAEWLHGRRHPRPRGPGFGMGFPRDARPARRAAAGSSSNDDVRTDGLAGDECVQRVTGTRDVGCHATALPHPRPGRSVGGAAECGCSCLPGL